jgi:hypothetical protein
MTTTLRDSDTDVRIRAAVAELLRLARSHDARLAHIEALLARTHGPRDGMDRQLFLALAQHIHLPFRAASVFILANRERCLDEALRDADVDSTVQLGKLLRRFEGTTVEHIRLERSGRFWQFVRVER